MAGDRGGGIGGGELDVWILQSWRLSFAYNCLSGKVEIAEHVYNVQQAVPSRLYPEKSPFSKTPDDHVQVTKVTRPNIDVLIKKSE